MYYNHYRGVEPSNYLRLPTATLKQKCVTSLGKNGANIDMEQKLRKLPSARVRRTRACCLVKSWRRRGLGRSGATSLPWGEQSWAHLVPTAWVLQKRERCWGPEGGRTGRSPGWQWWPGGWRFSSENNTSWLLLTAYPSSTSLQPQHVHLL